MHWEYVGSKTYIESYSWVTVEGKFLTLNDDVGDELPHKMGLLVQKKK